MPPKKSKASAASAPPTGTKRRRGRPPAAVAVKEPTHKKTKAGKAAKEVDTAVMETSPEHNSKQASQAMPTIEEVKEWDEDELLEWIRQKRPKLLQGDDLENFKAARISGEAFLLEAGNAKFFQEWNLSYGSSVVLADLARQIKDGETAAIKRDREQAGLAEPSDTNKKRRVDSEINPELLDIAKRARERSELIVKKITTIERDAAARLSNAAVQPSGAAVQPSGAAVQPLGAAVELSSVVAELSSPTFHIRLPFPFVGTTLPRRFKVEDGGGNDWFYVGRERFTELLDLFRIVRRRPDRSALLVYGTKGYGKSHLLAALVCYLVAQKERVVYIPDCRECINYPVGYVRAAMLFAWADDSTIQDEIITLKTQEMIQSFFERDTKSIFVIDQMNAFGESENNKDKNDKLKIDIHNWLEGCRAGHPAVLSTSANYQTYLRQRDEENSKDTMHVYGGFSTREMEQWWQRNSEGALEDHIKAQVEDITGGIPLLLDKCAADGKINLDVTAFRNICHEAAAFVQTIKTKTRDRPSEWTMYYNYVKACFSRSNIPTGSPGHPELIDHRYFYHYEYKPSDQDAPGDYGNYTCGLVRNAVAAELLASKVNFADTDFLKSLSDFITNPSVAGFMIEYAVLSSIGSNGLAIGGAIQESMDMITFMEATPNFQKNITGRPVLYRPGRFNFKGIDGVIVWIEPRPKLKGKGKGIQKQDAEEGKRKLFMYPFQITLARKSHSDSHQIFFDQYDKWIKGLEEFDIEPQFLWITPDPPSYIDHPKGFRPRWPEHRERNVCLQDVNDDIWSRYKLALQDKEKPGDTGTEGQGATEQGVQKHTGAGEQEDTGDQGDTGGQGDTGE